MSRIVEMPVSRLGKRKIETFGQRLRATREEILMHFSLARSVLPREKLAREASEEGHSASLRSTRLASKGGPLLFSRRACKHRIPANSIRESTTSHASPLREEIHRPGRSEASFGCVC